MSSILAIDVSRTKGMREGKSPSSRKATREGTWQPRGPPSRAASWSVLALEEFEHFLEAPGVALLGLGKRFEPFGDVVEALFASDLCHAGVHRLVFVRLAGDRRSEVLFRVSDGKAGGGIPHLLQVVEMAMGVTCLSVGGLLKVACNFRVSLHVGHLGEVEITTVRLGLARERFLEVLMGLRA